MKYTISHPILIDAIPKGRKSRFLVPSRTATTFDIPVFREGVDAELALRAEVAKNVKGGGFTEIMAVGSELYEAAFNKEGQPIRASSFNAVSPLVEATITEVVQKEIDEALQNGSTPKLLRMHDGVPLIGGRHRTKTDPTNQPPVTDLPQDTINHEAMRATIESLTNWIRSEFVIIGSNLYRRTAEPFYAVTAETSISLVRNQDIPDDAIAIFKLGRLDDARAFRNAASMQFGSPLDTISLREFQGAYSDLDDIALTIASTSCKAVRSFKSAFGPSISAKRTLDDLMFTVPLDQIRTARKLADLTSNRSIHDLAKDAADLIELLDEVVSYGNESPFVSAQRHKRCPYDIIVDLWHNRTIDLDIPVPGMQK